MRVSRSICVAAHGIISSFLMAEQYSTVIFHVPHLYPFICPRAFRLFPYLGYCKCTASERRGVCSFSNYSFVENMLFMFLLSLIYSIKFREAAMCSGSDYLGSDTSSGAY